MSDLKIKKPIKTFQLFGILSLAQDKIPVKS